MAYVSALTIDSDMVTASIGGSLYIGEHWRFDAVYAHVFASDVTVTPQEAVVPRFNREGNQTQTAAVHGGTSTARADVLVRGACVKLLGEVLSSTPGTRT